MKRRWYVDLGLVLAFIVFFFFTNAVASNIAYMVSTRYGYVNTDRGMQIALLLDIVSIITVLVFSKYVLKLDRSKLWMKDKNLLKNIGKGYAVGILLFVAFIGISIITKTITYGGRGSLPLIDVLLFIPAFGVQSFSEELLTRGLLQRVIKDRWGVVPSILLPSAIFMALHLANNGINFFAIVNLVVVGILFALMVYSTGSLWYAGAAHAAWNYFQGVIFGQNVSGMGVADSVLKFTTIGTNEIMTGGKFGPEGTLTVAVILTMASIYYYNKWKNKNFLLED